MVWMPVATKLIVGHHHLGSAISDDAHQVGGCREQICIHEGTLMVIAWGVHHARIPVLTRFTEQLPIGDSEFRHGRAEFALAVWAEAVGVLGGQVGQVRNQHFALFTQGACHQGDRGAFGDVFCHRDPGSDGFVVRMGVDDQKSATAHGAPDYRLWCTMSAERLPSDADPRPIDLNERVLW